MAELHKRNPSLQGNYWLTVVFVLLAFCPDLFIRTLQPLLDHLGNDQAVSRHWQVRSGNEPLA